ncbi:MAG: SDR family NAD(P)-dependent oxidoreductase, partial [Acetobacteraceae bacterium]|nr:SDR family NAD(P)-dependent oxidoreductase [Acetobacteraceae bacterium]
MFELTNKVAVVTGCDTGLGQGMAIALAGAGCAIVGINIVAPTETAERIAAEGGRFVSIEANLATASPIALIEQAVAAFGRIDILVNTAGIIRRADALLFSERDWDVEIDI